MQEIKINYEKVRRFIELYLLENTHLGILNLPCNYIEGIKSAMEVYDFKKIFQLENNETWDDLYEFQKAYIKKGQNIFEYEFNAIMNFYYNNSIKNNNYLYQRKIKITEKERLDILNNYSKEERLDMVKLSEGINQICYNIMPINYDYNDLHILTKKW